MDEGYPVVDAHDWLNVRIKPVDHIGAVCRQRRKCPVYKACMRTFQRKGIQDCKVGAEGVKLMFGNVWYRYRMDRTSVALVRGYDEHEVLVPTGCEIQMGPYAPSRRLGARAGEPSGSNKRNKKADPNHQGSNRPTLRRVDVKPLGEGEAA